MQIIDKKSLDKLFQSLTSKGFEVIGPTDQNNAITHETLKSLSDLPIGWTDRQAAGTYRIFKHNHGALFGYVVGPHSWKRFLYPAAQRLWEAEKDGNCFKIVEEKKKKPKYAFLGVRSCDLHAISIQDKVFLGGSFIDPVYQSHRQEAFIIAVNCTKPGGNCFCVSMESGPNVSGSFDLALTEVLQEDRHYFVVQAGSDRGKELMADIPHRPADRTEIDTSESLVKKAAEKMGRKLDTAHIKELLYRNLNHPHWDIVAGRCLSCANCTMTCPTCFCSTMEDMTDLSGNHAERWRKWDSCFTMNFSYIHGGYIRPTVKACYRQWMTHKLAGWIDQF